MARRFYVPFKGWEKIYPPEQYVGVSIPVEEGLEYAKSHLDHSAYLDWYFGGKKYGTEASADALKDDDGILEFFADKGDDTFVDGWLEVDEDEMCPSMDDYNDPKDTGHGYWDFY